jgi:hypothetical protein
VSATNPSALFGDSESELNEHIKVPSLPLSNSGPAIRLSDTTYNRCVQPMKKLIAFEFISLDGFMAGSPGHEMAESVSEFVE